MSPPPGGGSPLPAHIDVTPDEINGAARVFAFQQFHVFVPAVDHLTNVLNGCGGMAGNDTGAHNFAKKYDPAAAAAIQAIDTAIGALGSMANALQQTANNYILADHHSTAGASGAPETYPVLDMLTAEMDPAPPSCLGPGSSALPGPLAKYWPNGHQDKLRAAANAWNTTAIVLGDMATTLHQQVTTLTDNNSSASVSAMNDFWNLIWGANGDQGCLGVVHKACGQLRDACNNYASAIDSAHSKMEHALVGAGIAIGVTSAVGFVVGLFSFGGGDAAAGVADAAEASAILGPIADEFAVEVSTEVDAAIEAELVPMLQAAADATPELETVEADTAQVERVLQQEMSEEKVPARVGGGGGDDPPGSGGKPPTGGSDDDPGSGDEGDDGESTDPRDVHGKNRAGQRQVDEQYVRENGDLYIQNGDGQMVRVLDNGNGTSDVVIYDPSNPSGGATTTMRVPNSYVQNKVESGAWD